MPASVLRVKYTFIAQAKANIPLLPVRLISPDGSVLEKLALVDSGAQCSVLPRQLGDALGLDWDSCRQLPNIGGALSACRVKLALIYVGVSRWEPIEIGFAWAENDFPPLILGQSNFFDHFRICFSKAALAFDIRPDKPKANP